MADKTELKGIVGCPICSFLQAAVSALLNDFADEKSASVSPVEGAVFQFVIKYVASLLLIFMGSMDCLTTVIGTLYFGTQELNPLIANLVNTNLFAFVVVKLVVTVSVGLIFVFAEKALMSGGNRADKSFRIAHNTLIAAYVGIIAFLVLVVLNNVLVLLRTL